MIPIEVAMVIDDNRRVICNSDYTTVKLVIAKRS